MSAAGVDVQSAWRDVYGHGSEVDSDRLVAANEEAAGFFGERLAAPEGAGPRGYLSERRLDDVVEGSAWLVGYAPPGWTGLVGHLRDRGFGDGELLAAGLATRSRLGSLVDGFRDRVMLGIRDPDGRLVGFIGRAAPNTGEGVPKYLNTPGTAVFDKSRLLFGLAEQADQLRSGAVPVLVEGPLDVLAVAAANRSGWSRLAAVAPCGTTITDRQAAALGRVRGGDAGPVLVAFDADPAGRAAAARAYGPLATQGHPLLAADLPPGHDPASLFARQGGEGLRTGLSRTRPLADLVVDTALEPFAGRLDNAALKVVALRTAVGKVASMRPDEAGRQAARLTTILGLDADTVTYELAEAATPTQTPRRTTVRSTGRVSTSRGGASGMHVPGRPAPTFPDHHDPAALRRAV